MNDNAAPTRAERSKNVRTHVVTVDGKVLAYVRHHGVREAQAYALTDKVETRACTEDELMAIGRDNLPVIGPFEPVKQVDDGQYDLLAGDRDSNGVAAPLE